jgi:hypothetical protein
MALRQFQEAPSLVEILHGLPMARKSSQRKRHRMVYVGRPSG